MKEFAKDYWQLCKDCGQFYKKHWKGVIVLNAAIIGAEMLWFYKDNVKDAIEEKLHKRGVARN